MGRYVLKYSSVVTSHSFDCTFDCELKLRFVAMRCRPHCVEFRGFDFKELMKHWHYCIVHPYGGIFALPSIFVNDSGTKIKLCYKVRNYYHIPLIVSIVILVTTVTL